MTRWENAQIKNKAPRQVPLYGGVPRSGGVVREFKNEFPFCPQVRPYSHTSVIASETKQSSQLCTHANACDFIIHWIATVTAFPRDDKGDRYIYKKIL